MHQLQAHLSAVRARQSICACALGAYKAIAEDDAETASVWFHCWKVTTDAILALRLLSEIHRQFSLPLCVAHVDIKWAFDSVDRVALWKALRARGVPDVLLKLVEDLHTHSGARVRMGGSLSSRFATTSGVRQGCVLAPALFTVAIDWIMGHLEPHVGINVGTHRFTDLIYTDDAAGLLPDASQTARTLNTLSTAAAPFGLKLSWTKTKLQSLGSGPPAETVIIGGTPVESVDEFIYLGSKQTSDGYCRPDMLRRIALASSVMGSLCSVWRCSQLSLKTKVHLYRALVMSVLLYSAETWTLLVEDIQKLEAFHMRCQRQILNVHWWDHVTNASVLEQTGLTTISEHLSRRRISLFGHVARMDAEVPANGALRLMVDQADGFAPDDSWRRPRGRPRKTWMSHIRQDSGIAPSELWENEVAKGHGAAQRSPETTR